MSVSPGQEPVNGAGDSPAPTPSPGGNPTPAPNPAPAPAEVVFTPEQQAVINKLVGQARQEGRNAAQAVKPPVQTPAPTPAPQPEPKVTLEDIARELAETKMRARFDKHALRRGLTDEAADDLFDLYRVQKPTDDEQWFGEREKRLGLKQSTATPAATTQPTTTAPVVQVAPNTAPISDHGAPAQSGGIGWRFELAQSPMSMSKTAIAQMNAELGEEKARKQRLEAARGQAERIRVVVKPQG